MNTKTVKFALRVLTKFTYTKKFTQKPYLLPLKTIIIIQSLQTTVAELATSLFQFISHLFIIKSLHTIYYHKDI